ncbi:MULTISPECIES: endopeptidase La [Acidobacterium]|uniref:Lon protease n=1 Tax=Acidobacterium capsulatum (strain ATCC 51196 / DSM 11244 / BCRC 80197 / JCM 7670 / NBRC 15755 / NCIMB 13165 / 161) TaxID=240015 RepID=C1F6W2_ACIC5|nr:MULTISPECIES: endopeptidase La [Acidobacterium]ACO33934.1 endopeptidase LA [Acidobacterium capsulatum ATCC 51196]HCT59414.1 endopeptidase La [Acidobacterium sp.]
MKKQGEEVTQSKDPKDRSETRKLPMMPIRDMVIFPHMMTPFVVGRESSVRALEEALTGDRKIFLATQHDARVDEPRPDDIYSVGTIGNIVQSVKMPDGNIKVLVEGLERARCTDLNDNDGFFVATVRTYRTPLEMTPAVEQLAQRVTSLFEQYVKLQQSLNVETVTAAIRTDEPSKLADTIAANLQLEIQEKQDLLDIFDPMDRLNKIGDVLDIEIEKLNMDRSIQSRVKRQMEKAQKEYYLNEKIKAIQKELGRGEKSEFDELKKKIENAGMPADVLEKAVQELRKLEAMPPMSAESTVSRNYLDWLLAVPWKKKSKETRSIDVAEKVLNEDHYGLEKIKERILEFLAVRQLVKNPKGSILCFVGPPGVGKTSLGMSIAKATGRKFVRLSLGGVRDEAEIRGHRRTYIGALPGQIIQSMKKAGTRNPVMMLDEIDKMASDFRGDPASALLEVLDPEQNSTFQDHYLDVEYDLSQVLFVATANVLHTIPAPLQDRMEILRLHGYTEVEKLEIAKQYLIRKQREGAGLTEKNIVFEDDAVTAVIRNYTREAGVRNLERELGNICRKVARRVVKNGAKHKETVTAENVAEFLGVAKFRDSAVHEQDEIGLVNGLAWTEVGGSILQTEVQVLDGKGKLTLTGQLGDVMQESAQAALSYVRSRAQHLGLPREFYRNIDIHVHVPEGAIPKDGPSAGITLATALASALAKVPVRRDLAMTGEITLRGKVLAIGGLKEKLLAAHRAGIFEAILPEENRKDLAELPENLKSAMKLHFVDSMDEVLKHALAAPLPELKEDTPEVLPSVPPAAPARNSERRAHQ